MTNSTTPACPRCGAPLSGAGVVDGVCAACVGALNFDSETSDAEARKAAPAAPLTVEQLAPHFPQLEIISCLGRRGMGVVYKARHKESN